jgi:hypothetical protein
MNDYSGRDAELIAQTLEDEFDLACQAAIDECRALRPPYVPTAWTSMIGRHGAVEAAQRLVVSGDIQSGFGRLVKAGRPDLTIEWTILHPRWRSLFGRSHREASIWRLREAGIEPPVHDLG